ncbi:hypothetical protein TNCV_4218971 [Trichonephila clavipes]|nr:hypothetical protein TNCV_4218971 [Trichonephila clavipes]
MPPDWQRPDRGPRNPSFQRAKGCLSLSRDFEHHTGDSTICLVSTTILRENALGVGRGLRSHYPFTQPHERT